MSYEEQASCIVYHHRQLPRLARQYVPCQWIHIYSKIIIQSQNNNNKEKPRQLPCLARQSEY
jgi:hypothetical protein